MTKYKLVKKIDNQSGGVYAMYSPYEDTIQVASPMLPTVNPLIQSYPRPNIMGPKIRLHNTVPVIPVVSSVPPVLNTTCQYGCNKPNYANIQCSRNIPQVPQPYPCSCADKKNYDTNILDLLLKRFGKAPSTSSPMSDDLPPILS